MLKRMSFEAKLAELGLTLPEVPTPIGSYLPAVRAGNLLFLSGQLPLRDGKLIATGKVGGELSVEEGQEAARQATLNAFAIIRQELGSLDQVDHVVRLVGHVASAPGFGGQATVVNGASDLLGAVFGQWGKHARLAVGAAELPLNAPVEIELIVQVRS